MLLNLSTIDGGLTVALSKNKMTFFSLLPFDGLELPGVFPRFPLASKASCLKHVGDLLFKLQQVFQLFLHLH